jgi:hypothetical protein
LYKTLLLIIPLLLLFTCSEDPHQLIVNIYNEEIPGVVKDTTLIVLQDTSHFQTSEVNTRFSLRLGLGTVENLECRPIFRFTDYSTLPDSAQIDSAWIKLFSIGSVNEGSSLPFTARMHPIFSTEFSTWEGNLDSIWNDPDQSIDRGTILSELQISPDDTNDYLFTLNDDGLELIRTWADTATTPDENYGFIIDFEMADYIQYFSAISAGADPELILKYSLPADTAVYRDTLLANYDAFLYEGDFPRQEARNYSSSLIVHHSILQFNFNDFLTQAGGEVTILSANLELPVDRDNSLLDPLYDIGNLVVLNLESEIHKTPIISDSTIGTFATLNTWSEDSSYVEVSPNDNRKILANMIRAQLANQKEPLGFVISIVDDASNRSSVVSDEKEQFSYLAFYTSKETDFLKKARLTLEYWVPAKPRL